MAHVGKALIIEDAKGNTSRCKKRSQLEAAAVGDEVEWMITEEGAGRVEKILPRRSLLSRPAKSGATRPVAANIDQLVAILAVKPNIDALLLDQYLIVCELQGITPLIVLNKIDLLDGAAKQKIDKLVANYQQLGYELIKVSAKDKSGLQQLSQRLYDKTSILVGQSGVGKSSLINALIPDLALQTKVLSTVSGLGKHTTTSSTLYKLTGGGEVIDSPGVNIFGLADITEYSLASGYREIRQLADQCKYANCLHLREPKCAVKDAVENGAMSQARYARYLKLREKLST